MFSQSFSARHNGNVTVGGDNDAGTAVLLFRVAKKNDENKNNFVYVLLVGSKIVLSLKRMVHNCYIATSKRK